MHLIVISIVFFKLKVTRRIANIYTFCHRFCMVDVFILGVMVSLIKLVSLADISFHPGFLSAVIFAMLMVWCNSHGSPYKIWNLVREHDEELRNATVGMRGIDQGLIMCRHCGMVYKRKGRRASRIGQEIESNNLACDDEDYLYRGEQVCPRCGHSNDNRAVMMYQKTAALLLAAVILYIPSNVYPIMFTSYLGSSLGSDILDGVIALWDMHSYFVASVILVASICIPIAKILCILFLLYLAKRGFKGYPSRYNMLYRIILFIGRWSMIDVFVVIIMSTVVRMTVLTISPGVAVVFFCFTVLITMLAAEEYDERMLWDKALAKNHDAIINQDGELVEAPSRDALEQSATSDTVSTPSDTVPIPSDAKSSLSPTFSEAATTNAAVVANTTSVNASEAATTDASVVTDTTSVNASEAATTDAAVVANTTSATSSAAATTKISAASRATKSAAKGSTEHSNTIAEDTLKQQGKGVRVDSDSEASTQAGSISHVEAHKESVQRDDSPQGYSDTSSAKDRGYEAARASNASSNDEKTHDTHMRNEIEHSKANLSPSTGIAITAQEANGSADKSKHTSDSKNASKLDKSAKAVDAKTKGP